MLCRSVNLYTKAMHNSHFSVPHSVLEIVTSLNKPLLMILKILNAICGKKFHFDHSIDLFSLS